MPEYGICSTCGSRVRKTEIGEIHESENFEEKDIIIRVKDEENTGKLPENEDKQFIYVDNFEQKRYAEYLRDEKGLGITTINTYLYSAKKFKEWRKNQ